MRYVRRATTGDTCARTKCHVVVVVTRRPRLYNIPAAAAAAFIHYVLRQPVKRSFYIQRWLAARALHRRQCDAVDEVVARVL